MALATVNIDKIIKVTSASSYVSFSLFTVVMIYSKNCSTERSADRIGSRQVIHVQFPGSLLRAYYTVTETTLLDSVSLP